MDQYKIAILLLLDPTSISSGCARGSRLSSTQMVPCSLLLLILLLPSELRNISSDDNVFICDNELVVLIELGSNVVDALNPVAVMHVLGWVILWPVVSLKDICSTWISTFRGLIPNFFSLALGSLLYH